VAVKDVVDVVDEAIQEYSPRETGYIDYRIGKTSVCYRGGEHYRCGTCQWPDNFQTPDHKGCAHIQRIVRYREGHGA
jgi:hypothetical protein